MLNTVETNPFNASPFVHTVSTEDKARQLHRLLLDLSKDESEKELRSAARATADFFREKFFGLTEAQTKARVIEVLKDYYDGEEYHALEIDNLSELVGVKASKLLPIVKKTVEAGTLAEGKRRRWQEPGKHYSPIYKLNG